MLEDEPEDVTAGLEERQQRAQVRLDAADHRPVPGDDEDARPLAHAPPEGLEPGRGTRRTGRRASTASHRGRT